MSDGLAISTWYSQLLAELFLETLLSLENSRKTSTELSGSHTVYVFNSVGGIGSAQTNMRC